MTAKEIHELSEKSDKSNRLKEDIFRRLHADEDFDVVTAWEEVNKLNQEIYDGLKRSSPRK